MTLLILRMKMVTTIACFDQVSADTNCRERYLAVDAYFCTWVMYKGKLFYLIIDSGIVMNKVLGTRQYAWINIGITSKAISSVMRE